MLVMGYMSGTSLDGVDVAMIETDGEVIHGFGPAMLLPFADDERTVLVGATGDALQWDGYGAAPASLGPAAAVIEAIHVRAGQALIDKAGRRPDLIGFHGQTMLHRPRRQLSVQIGDPQVLADKLGVPVIGQMRQNDLLAGGEGAPLVPAYHAALMAWLGLKAPVAFLNLGGVANLTWVGAGGQMMAFDTGPGNGLIDLVVQERGAGRYDDGGRLAASGHVDQAILAQLMSHDHFRGQGAKSLDRYDFPLDWTQGRRLEDAVATLTAFTAESVALAARNLPEAPTIWVVCGGGCHNPVLMQALRDRLGICRPADELGLRSDFVEAEAMGFLAARSLRGLPLTFPGTTGVGAPTIGGELWRPASAEVPLV